MVRIRRSRNRQLLVNPFGWSVFSLIDQILLFCIIVLCIVCCVLFCTKRYGRDIILCYKYDIGGGKSVLVSTIFNGGNLSHRQKSTNAVLYINCNRENQLIGWPA